MLPVIRQPQFDESLKQSVPNALFGHTEEAHIDRLPLSVSFMHVAPRAAEPKNILHAVHLPPIIARAWTSSPVRRELTLQ